MPVLSAGIAETDNLTLAPDDPERATVFQVVPSFSLTQKSPSLTAGLDYRGEVYYYRERGDTDVHHSFEGQLNAALDPDNFFFDVGVSRAQTLRSPDAQISRSNLPINANRVDRDDYFAGPTFKYPVGPNVTVSGGYHHRWVRYPNTDAAPDSLVVTDWEEDSTEFGVDNYRKERGVTWATRYQNDTTDYEFVEWENRRVSFELGGWVANGLRLFARYGKESPWDDPFDAGLEDNFWEAGFAKQAGKNFNAEVAAGERSFGSSKRASFDFTFRHGRTALSYTEEPTTAGRDVYGQLSTPTDPQDYLSRLGPPEHYIMKRLDWAIGFDLRSASVSVSVFDEDREGRMLLDGTPLGDETQKGWIASGTWHMGARTDLVLTAEQSKTDAGVGQTFKSTTLAANYRLGSRTRLSLSYGHATERADQPNFADFDYTSNVVAVLLTRNL